MAKALYRKYRSRTLSEVVGQTHVTEILARSLANGHVAHAYLLTGPKGVGKTSIARILAHEINQLPYNEDSSYLDIIEIDAASNNGVEDVRDLRDKVQITPVSAAKKVYIIDEVHMLSKAAFNALLKTLEEPPEHVVFILATTDANKLPDTIISRTQRFTFRTIAPEAVTAHLKEIAEKEKITIDDEALDLIALRGEGSFRDSIGLLDQLRSLTDDKQGITRQLVEQALGLAPAEYIEQLIAAYETKDLAKIVTLLDESTNTYTQPDVLASQLTHTIRQHIAEKPQLIDLLDRLLEVPKSSQPSLKLLTVLATGAKTPLKSAALSAPMPEIKASVEELSESSSPHPSSPLRDGFAPGLKSGPGTASDLGLQISRSDDEGAARQSQGDDSTPARVARGGAAPLSSLRDKGADRVTGPADSDLRETAKGSFDDGSGVRRSEAKDLRLLDPFCGTGVVLQEAALQGYDIYGTDLSEKMIDYTRVNLDWLAQTHRLTINANLHQADAREAQWQQPINTVVCESYLGQPFSAPPSPSKLTEVRGNCNHIVSEFLQNIASQLQPGTPLCIAVPAWRDDQGNFTHLPLIDSIEKLGFKRHEFKNIKNEDLLYFRPDQVVARELLVLTSA